MAKRSQPEDVSDAELRAAGYDPDRFIHINDPQRLDAFVHGRAPAQRPRSPATRGGPVPPIPPSPKPPWKPTDGHQRGMENERRALRACQELQGYIDWMLPGARACTPEEDRRGIDIVVPTTHGDLHLQVKSSKDGARRFRKQYPHAEIAVVVIETGLFDKQVQGRVLGALIRLRAHVHRRQVVEEQQAVDRRAAQLPK